MIKKKSILDQMEDQVIDAAKSYAEEKVKKKLIQIGEISAFILLAMFLISFGLAELLGNYVSILSNGLNYILVGIIFFIIGIFFSR